MEIDLKLERASDAIEAVGISDTLAVSPSASQIRSENLVAGARLLECVDVYTEPFPLVE